MSSRPPPDMPSALEGLRVLDFSHVYQGPVATQLLADFGADVIKVERPGSGDWSRSWGPFVRGVSMPFANLNRNKRSLAVDTKTPAGREIVLELVRSADVLVHNFRGGVMEKLGLGYAQLSPLNPRLIYASSNGWGDTGPSASRGRGGHDLMARAEAGWFVRFADGRPPIPGGISADYPAGLILLQGILIALLARGRTGRGQELSTDLYSVAFHAHAWDAASQLNADRIDEPARVGGAEAAIDKAFATNDGYIEISPVFSHHSLRDISLALGFEDLSRDPRFATESLQIENRAPLNEILAARFKEKSTGEWMRLLESHGVLCARINTFEEAAADPQIAANQMVLNIEHPQAGPLRVLGNPLRLHDTGARHRSPPPGLGEHNRQILSELGYSTERIDALFSEGVLS